MNRLNCLSANEKRTGGELLAEALRAAGVSQAFALHGGHLESLFKACVEQGIDLLDFRHEASAGHAADAYARATDGLGVCMITAGPGFANAMPAIANAKLDGIPVLFIIGAPPLREVETNPLQGGIDQIAMARPCAKWAVSVPATERIPDLAAMAIRKAMTGPKGPVVLEMPIDVLHMSVPAARATRPTGLRSFAQPAPNPDEPGQLHALLSASARPVIVAGMEAATRAGSAALVELAERTGIPVYHKTTAAGVMPSSHPSAAGPAAGLALLDPAGAGRPDLVILLGGRLGLLLGGRSGLLIPDDAKLVQIHTDASEIGRLRDVDLAICADSARAAAAFTAAIDGMALPDFTAWRDAAVGAGRTPAAAWPVVESDKGIHPYHAAAAVAEAAGASACYVFDGGEAASWAAMVATAERPGTIVGLGYLGCLGIGPGMAIGMQTAHPDRRVVQITGDGGLGFHIQELDTMVRHRLPIVTVVLNNEVWGMSIHGQQIMFGANYNVISRLGGTNFSAIAGGFGCYSERVTKFADVAPAMRRALDSGRPALVEIMTDPDVVHPITIGMLGQVAEGSTDVMIPYYENIPASMG